MHANPVAPVLNLDGKQGLSGLYAKWREALPYYCKSISTKSLALSMRCCTFAATQSDGGDLVDRPEFGRESGGRSLDQLGSALQSLD